MSNSVRDKVVSNTELKSSVSGEKEDTPGANRWVSLTLTLCFAFLVISPFVVLDTSALSDFIETMPFLVPLSGLGMLIVTVFALFDAKREEAQADVAKQALSDDTADHSATVDFLADALETVSEGYARFDKQGALIFFNTPLLKMFPDLFDEINEGLSFEELLTRMTGRKIFAEDHCVSALKQAWDVRSENVQCLEMRDGRSLGFELREAKDKTLTMLVSDLTVLKMREQELDEAKFAMEKQASEMWDVAVQGQQASRAKSDFLAVISHEIRTPMNAIVGLSDLMEQTRLNEEQAKYASGINDAATHLLGLINNILDFSRLDSSHYSLDHSPFDLRTALENVVDMGRGLAREKNIDFHVSIPDDMPNAVLGDSGRFSQVLLNLVANAVKFTDEGSVEVGVKVLNVRDSAAQLSFFVADTGPGFSEALKKHLFQPFRKDRSWSMQNVDSANGTGLGLAISRRLIELMDGSIEIDQTRTQGALVHFNLSFDTVDERLLTKEDDTAIAKPEPLPPMRILVAEDTPASQLVIRTMLEKQGHKVQTVTTGLEAVEALKISPFDLVLMDIEMPEMDGIEATMEIRERKAPYSNVPIVALTAQALEIRRGAAFSAGMDDYLIKPLRSGDLHTVLARYADEMMAREVREARMDVDLDLDAMPAQEDADAITEALFDGVLLSDMAGALGYDDFIMLFDKFEANAKEQLEKLDQALDVEDDETISSIAHRLVGLFSQFGVANVAELAAKTENAMSEEERLDLAARTYENGVLSLKHVATMLEQNMFFPERAKRDAKHG